MSLAVSYIEKAKIDELAAELEANGYEVVRDAPIGRARVDILASKAGRKVAYEVKARPLLAGSLDEIDHLGKLARQHGIQEFRLMVVPLPRETAVRLEGIENTLLHLLRDSILHQDRDLLELIETTAVEQVRFDQVDIQPGHFRVVGDGILVSLVANDNSSPGEPARWRLDSPFQFDITTRPDMSTALIHKLTLDTARIRSYLQE